MLTRMPPGHTLSPGADSEAIADLLDRIERDVAQCALPSATVDRVVLVAGELASNVAEHGDEPGTFWWEPLPGDGGGALCLSPGPDASTIRGASLPEAHAVRGRGLFLVHTLGDDVARELGTLRVQFKPRVKE